jgi:tRNA pseudouridine65 synthase
VTAAVIVYRGDDLVAADKPPGLLVHRGWAREPDVLMTRVRDAVGCWVHPLHRIDRGASGVVLFALSPEAARRVGAALAERRVDKRYLALVRGAPPDRLVIDHPIERRPGGPRVDSVTEVLALARFGRYSMVAARPRTGRLHQIRRHLKHISCPLIGDVKYGKGEHNRLFRDRYDLRRLALHALSVSLVDRGEVITARAPIAADLAAALARLAEASGTAIDLEAIADRVAAWPPA